MAISRRSMMLGTAAGGAAALTLAACGSDDGGAGSGSDAGGGSGEPIYANTTEPENPLLPANTGEVGGGQIDLVEHGQDLQVVLQGQVGVGQGLGLHALRSEERRVGKECRSRWSPYH